MIRSASFDCTQIIRMKQTLSDSRVEYSENVVLLPCVESACIVFCHVLRSRGTKYTTCKVRPGPTFSISLGLDLIRVKRRVKCSLYARIHDTRITVDCTVDCTVALVCIFVSSVKSIVSVRTSGLFSVYRCGYWSRMLTKPSVILCCQLHYTKS